MTIHKRLGLVIPALLALGLGFGVFANAADKPADTKLGKNDVVMKDDARCTTCHDETSSYPVLAIGKTKHGTSADSRTPTCTTCHGASEDHIKKKEGQKERSKPDVTFGGQYKSVEAEGMVERYFGKFGRQTTTPVADRNEVCLSCHKGDNRMHWSESTHANRGIGCTNCPRFILPMIAFAPGQTRLNFASVATRSSVRCSTGRPTTRCWKARWGVRIATTSMATTPSS